MSEKNIVEDLLFPELSYRIVGICMKVHSTLGKGFKEAVYMDAIEIELNKNGIKYEREKIFKIYYEGEQTKRTFRADFFIENSIVLEVKAELYIRSDNMKQTVNYLKVSGIKLAIIGNFGESSFKFKRLVCSHLTARNENNTPI